jgi:hypothetical protein
MDIVTILYGLAVLISLAMVVGSFVSKTIVWGIPQRKPQKITLLGRIWLFVFGVTGACEFGLLILKRGHVSSTLPAWLDTALKLGRAISFLLFLYLVVSSLILSIRNSFLAGEETSKFSRLTTVVLTAIFLYLFWETIPGMAKEVSAVFHHITSWRR